MWREKCCTSFMSWPAHLLVSDAFKFNITNWEILLFVNKKCRNFSSLPHAVTTHTLMLCQLEIDQVYSIKDFIFAK